MASRAVAAVLAGAAAFAFVAFATQPPGPGLDPDAASYIGAGVSLVRSGLYRIPTSSWTASDTTEPLAHFPPGFPTAIALPVALGIPPVQAARIVIAVSAFVTAAVISALMDTVLLGALAVAVIFLTPAVVDMHLSVLSEPLFIAILVAALAIMVRQAERPGWFALIALGLLAAAALMVRYAGAGVVAAAVLWVLAQRGPWRRRLRDATIAALPTLCVLGVWVAHATQHTGATGIRRFAVYGHLGATLRVGASTVADWLAPGLSAAALSAAALPAAAPPAAGAAAAPIAGPAVGPTAGPMAIGLLVVLRWAVALTVAAAAASMLAAAWRSRDATRRGRIIIGAAASLVGCSAIVVIASRLLADPNIPFDERILAPSIVLAELAAVAALGYARRSARVVLGAWALGSAIVSVIAVRSALEDGNDFASADWRFSPTVAWVADSATGRTLYTNWPVALYFHAHRDAHGLPSVLEPLTLRRFGDRLARTHGLVVAFNTPSPDAAPPDSIAARLRLQPVARLSDGTVWEYPVMSADARPRAASGSP